MSLLGWFGIIFLLGAGVLTVYVGWCGAPFFPTPWRAVEAALDLARVGPHDTLIDFGAGDGRVVVAAARRGARAIGYELSPFFWVLARLRLALSRSSGELRFRDAFGADLSEATVLFLFLTPRTVPAVARHLRARVRPGTCVLSYAFPVPDWVPTRVEKPSGCGTLYLYVIPERLTVASSPRLTL
jgi:hypothetical protein